MLVGTETAGATKTMVPVGEIKGVIKLVGLGFLLCAIMMSMLTGSNLRERWYVQLFLFHRKTGG